MVFFLCVLLIKYHCESRLRTIFKYYYICRQVRYCLRTGTICQSLKSMRRHCSSDKLYPLRIFSKVRATEIGEPWLIWSTVSKENSDPSFCKASIISATVSNWKHLSCRRIQIINVLFFLIYYILPINNISFFAE